MWGVPRYGNVDWYRFLPGVSPWVMAAHAFNTFYIFPRLSVKAPEKQCGKTTLLDVIGCLVPRKLSTESITPAATYRTIEAFRPTLLLLSHQAAGAAAADSRAVTLAAGR